MEGGWRKGVYEDQENTAPVPQGMPFCTYSDIFSTRTRMSWKGLQTTSQKKMEYLRCELTPHFIPLCICRGHFPLDNVRGEQVLSCGVVSDLMQKSSISVENLYILVGN